MNWNQHSRLIGAHAFLGASKYAWLGYSDEKLADAYRNFLAIEKGTRLHAFAAECIRLGQKLPKSNKTLNMYVNDAVAYHMLPEQVLYFSDNCFGTTDAISFRNEELRISDLKTGATPAKMDQLKIYNALFCLEYKVKPTDIHTELRIYQNNQIVYDNPDPNDILRIMDQIPEFDRIINAIKDREGDVQ